MVVPIIVVHNYVVDFLFIDDSFVEKFSVLCSGLVRCRIEGRSVDDDVAGCPASIVIKVDMNVLLLRIYVVMDSLLLILCRILGVHACLNYSGSSTVASLRK